MLKFFAFAATAILMTLPAQAAPDTHPGTASSKPARASTGVMRYDTNGDGFVDRAEWNAGQEARFKQLDTNTDGKLTRDELFARTPAAAAAAATANADLGDRQARRQTAYFQNLDSDKDGFVSKAEFMAQASRNFVRCDLDKDGRINTAECRQALQRKTSAEPASADR
jgi:Ca2+-binding EF-hand superfamily protein